MRVLLFFLLFSCASKPIVIQDEPRIEIVKIKHEKVNPWYLDKRIKLHNIWVDGCMQASQFWIMAVTESLTKKKYPHNNLDITYLYNLCSHNSKKIFHADKVK